MPRSIFEARANVGAAFAAGTASQLRPDIGQSVVIRPAVGVYYGVMIAVVIAAIHHHLVDALVAHLAEGDYRDGLHLQPLRCVSVLSAL